MKEIKEGNWVRFHLPNDKRKRTAITDGKEYLVTRTHGPDHDYIRIRNDKGINFYYHKKHFSVVEKEGV